MAVLRMACRSEIADGDADGVELAVGQLVLVMPIGIGFCGGQTLALDGVADDRRRPARGEGNPVQGLAERADVMAVQLLDRKAEAAPFVSERLERQHIVGWSVALQLVWSI